jgi:hypothetical protein
MSNALLKRLEKIAQTRRPAGNPEALPNIAKVYRKLGFHDKAEEIEARIRAGEVMPRLSAQEHEQVRASVRRKLGLDDE